MGKCVVKECVSRSQNIINQAESLSIRRKCVTRRRWEYGRSEFKLRRLLERRRFTRVHSDDSEDEPAPMLPPTQPSANA